jgi:predicted CXXCH cytochrome family protein
MGAAALVCLVVSFTLVSLSAPAFAQLKKGRVFKAEKKTCIDCHKKETRAYKGRKSTHAPVRQDQCETCHLKHGVVGILRLVADDPDLCLACHGPEGEVSLAGGRRIPQGSKASERREYSHPPGDGLKCGACHDPHGSDSSHLLKDVGPVGCLNCHGNESFQGTSRHPPESVDCLTCHDPHGSSIEGSLVKSADSICADCHDGGSPTEVLGHGGGRPAAGSCLSCHTPHASPDEGLLRLTVHPPMAGGGEACGSCHDIGSDAANPFALMAEGPDLCLACHEDPREGSSGGGEGEFRIHVPLAEGECQICHAPHASDQDALLVDAQADLCGTCHEEAVKATSSSAFHAPAKEACTNCHLPHAGGPTFLTVQAPELCTTCHESVTEEAARDHSHPPAAEGECLTCHEPHGSAHAGILRDAPSALCGACHEAVEVALGARFVHAPVVSGDCVACHEPHGSDQETLIVSDLGSSCLGCHENESTSLPDGGRHAPFDEGECLICHSPHSSSRENLLSSEPVILCRSCHEGVEGEVTAESRHAPVIRGQCLSCHGPHGGHEPSFLRREEPKVLCLSCHVDESEQMVQTRGSTHRPFTEGECLTCHNSHVSDHVSLLSESPGVLCASCPDGATQGMTRAHKGLITESTDCTGCHEPHVSENDNLMLTVQHAPFADGDCGACHQGETP